MNASRIRYTVQYHLHAYCTIFENSVLLGGQLKKEVCGVHTFQYYFYVWVLHKPPFILGFPEFWSIEALGDMVKKCFANYNAYFNILEEYFCISTHKKCTVNHSIKSVVH